MDVRGGIKKLIVQLSHVLNREKTCFYIRKTKTQISSAVTACLFSPHELCVATSSDVQKVKHQAFQRDCSGRFPTDIFGEKNKEYIFSNHFYYLASQAYDTVSVCIICRREHQNLAIRNAESQRENQGSSYYTMLAPMLVSKP